MEQRKQISNILQYGRGKNSKLNEDGNIETFMKNSSSMIYPSKNKAAICLPMIIILKARQATLNEFVKNHKSKKIIGSVPNLTIRSVIGYRNG